jgi:hypothetical protein
MSLPSDMIFCMLAPSGVPYKRNDIKMLTFWTSALNRSPVEMCVYPNSSTSLAHWVPLPDAGPPSQSTSSALTHNEGDLWVSELLFNVDAV